MKDFRKSVVYQIYPKSFKDSNQDGFGDLNGVIEKLDYLSFLGVDYIWLTPFYVSPQRDNGYDVADYLNIDPRFGTMEDFDNLVKEADKRNIGIMLDMVFNHTSTEHEWFKRALNGEKRYKDFYIFKDKMTNWQSKFGGSAWEYVEKFGEYYLHLFDVTQADLNWDNKEVRKSVYEIVNFWLDKGVKGLRFDVINLISKPAVFEDDFEGDGRRFYTDGPNIHKYLKELNRNTFGKYQDVITVGEMSSTTIDNCIKYSNPDEEELSMVFNFHHLKVDYKGGDKWVLMDFDFMELKNILNTWQIGMQQENGWSAVFWCNHDQPRIVSRFGDDKKYHKESAKMLATAIHMLRGTPYIYQGEEIGMTNAYFDKIEDYRDVESINYYRILRDKGLTHEEVIKIIMERSRDNSRTPMQWNNSLNAGFTTATPWINLAKNYTDINVEEQINNEDSILNHYRKLIEIRKTIDVVAYGDYKPLLEENRDVFSYMRSYNSQSILVVNNFYGKETEIDIPKEVLEGAKEVKILLSNYKDSSCEFDNLLLRPYESIVYYIVK